MNRVVPALLTMFVFLSAPAVLDRGAAHAQSANAFRISGVEIEGEGANAHAAKQQALSRARVVAMRLMLRRLTLPSEHGRLPEVSAQEVDSYIHGSQIESERISRNRYTARITFIFEADRIRNLLRDSNIAFVEVASQPVVVLPITLTESRPVLWDEPNVWRAAWTTRDPGTGGLVSFVDPAGNIEDLQAVSAEEAMAVDETALRRLAGRYDAGFVLIAVAEPGGGQMRITLRRFNVLTGATRDLGVREVENDETMLRETATAIARQMEETWKRDNLVRNGEVGSLHVKAPLENYGYWIRLRRNLESVSLVRRNRVLNLSPAEARIELSYVGTIDQLKVALSQAGLVLEEAPGQVGTEPRMRDSTSGRRPSGGATSMESLLGQDRGRQGTRESRDPRLSGGRSRAANDPGAQVPENAAGPVQARWILTLGSVQGQTR